MKNEQLIVIIPKVWNECFYFPINFSSSFCLLLLTSSCKHFFFFPKIFVLPNVIKDPKNKKLAGAFDIIFYLAWNGFSKTETAFLQINHKNHDFGILWGRKKYCTNKSASNDQPIFEWFWKILTQFANKRYWDVDRTGMYCKVQ